jgi:PAS domain S-box-containing protein
MERKTKPTMSKLRLPFFRRWKGQRASSSASTDVSADAFILFDKNLNIIGMNPVVRSLFHLILGENVIGADILNDAPNRKPDNKNNGRYVKYLNAIRKGKPFFADSIVIHSGFLDINLRAEAFKVGKGFGIIFSDIDALKKSDETQYESHGASATDFKSAADCIFIFDLKGTILHGSRAGEKLTGYPWEEIKGKSLLELPLFAPEYLPKAARLLELSAAGKSTGPDEFELLKRDGSHIFVEISTCPIGRGDEVEVIAIAHDITERKQAEEALRDSEEKYRAIVETTIDGIYQVDTSGKLTFINEAFANIFGYRREELLGKHFSSLLSVETFPKVKEMVEEVFSGENVRDEVSVQHKDGHEVLVNFSATPLKERDKIIGLTGILRDITERKQMEEELANSEAKYRSLIDTAGAGVATIDLTGKLIIVNEALCRMIGYSQEELLGRNFAEFLHPDDRTEVLEMFAKGLAGGKEQPHLEFRVIHKEGNNVWCHSRPTALVLDNETIGFSAIIHDITEHKKAEEMLRESEVRFRELFENMSSGVAVYKAINEGQDFVFKDFNKAGEGIEKIERRDVIGESVLDVFPGLKDFGLFDVFRRVWRTGNPEHHPISLYNDERIVGWRDNYVYKLPSGEVVAIYDDVTERKKLEEVLRESEEKYRALFHNAQVGLFRSRIADGKILECNDLLAKMFGYNSREECIAEHVTSERYVDPNARALELRLMTENGEVKDFEALVKRKDGSPFWISYSAAIYPERDYIEGVVIDITGRKQAEEALRQSEERFRNVLDNSLDMVYRLNLQTGTYDYVSPSTEKILGYSPEEFVAFTIEKGRSLSHPDDLARLDENVIELVTSKEGISSGIEYRIKHKELGYRWVSDSRSVIYDAANNPIAVVGNLRDITERKEAENALRESEQKFKDIFDNATDGILLVDSESRQIYTGNKMMCQMLGVSLGELETLGIEDIHPGERLPHVIEQFEKQARGKNTVSHDIPVKRKDGSVFYADINSSRITLAGKSYLMGIFRDITERKLAEDALKDSERKFRSVLEHSVDVIYQLNLKTGTYDYVSPSSVEALGYSPEELIALGFEKATSVIHPDDVEMIREHFNKLMKRAAADDKGPPIIEYRVKHRKLGYRWMSDTSSVLCDEQKVPIAIIGNVHNITERKKAEEALKESEERYRALVDTAGLAGEGIMIVERAEGNKAIIAFVNDTLAGVLGYQREEMLGMPARDLFLPGDRIWLQDKNRRKRKGEALPSHYGVMALRKDGSMLPIEISMGAMTYQGKTATVVYVRDVTERKVAEEALKESEAQFRAIFDGAAIGVRLVDKDERTFKINPAFEHMLGYTLEELRSMPATDYVHPDDVLITKGLFDEMVADKRDHYQVEKRFIRRDGQMVWGRVTISAVRGLGGKFQFAISMTEDVTDRKLSLENLRKSEEYFRALTENALEAIVIISKDGTISYGSPTIEPPRGYKPEDVIGTNGFSTVHPEDMPKVMNLYNELMQNPANLIRTQVRVRHKDGSWRTVEAVGKNLLDDPVVAGIVVNYRDVTEREQAHEALLRHTRQVEALHAIAQLASQTLELEELLNTALEKLVEVMDADAGCVYLLDTVEKELVLKTHRGISDDMILRVATIKLNENNVQKIKEWKGGSIPLQEIFEEIGLSITKEAREKEQIQSFAVAPFAVRGQLSGLIAVGNRADRKFSPGDIDLLRAVGNQIGISTQNAMLYEEVRALIRETIDAQETERERICLEVHDGVAQTLVAAFQYLQALEATLPDDMKGSPLLAKATVQVKQAIQESREIINSLQPATLSDLGLVSTLRHELKRLGQETGLKIDFKADAIRLSKDIETGLYRIIHEAIANARKHADTRRLRVKINSEDGGVRVEVRDWGKGFDQVHLDRARRRGTGLFSIRKRAELLKGTCEIQSKPGEGTTVCVDIPFVDAK